MGARKRNRSEIIKEEKKSMYYAKLNNCPTSPRKMRRVANLIKGMEITEALNILKLAPQEPAVKLRKLLLSAISNYQQKNKGVRVEHANLYVKTVFVNEGRTLKRLRTAPRGMGYRIRKRSNHVTLFIEPYPQNEEKND